MRRFGRSSAAAGFKMFSTWACQIKAVVSFWHPWLVLSAAVSPGHPAVSAAVLPFCCRYVQDGRDRTQLSKLIGL